MTLIDALRASRAFLITDMECCQSCPGAEGSTGVVAIAVEDNGIKTLHVANVGDRYALFPELTQQTTPVPIS
jgi:hypothetical protein